MLQKLFFILFLFGLCGIMYVAGIASSFYNLKPASGVVNALEAYTASKGELHDAKASPNEADALLAKKKTRWTGSLAHNGLTLLTLRYSSTAYLIDMRGDIVHRWDIPFSKVWPRPRHVTSPADDNWIYIEKAVALENGDLIAIYTAANATPYGYGMVKVDKDSNIIWKYSANTHHDFSIAPQTGNIHALIHKVKSDMHRKYPRMHSNLLADYIVTLSPDGEELNRISILKAFYDSPFKLMLNGYDKNSLSWDRLHTNSVTVITPEMAQHFPMFKAGQFLISLRNINALAVLDPTTKRIVWAYNGLWRAQHSPQLLPNGNILLLDNKGHVERKKIYSRALEFNPKTLGVIWDYTGTGKTHFFSEAFGRIQRLDNGNTLIVESMNGRIFEVTPNQKIVWDYKIPLIRRAASARSPQASKADTRIDEFTEEPLVFDPLISGIIVSAIRYDKNALPFINQRTHETGR